MIARIDGAAGSRQRRHRSMDRDIRQRRRVRASACVACDARRLRRGASLAQPRLSWQEYYGGSTLPHDKVSRGHQRGIHTRPRRRPCDEHIVVPSTHDVSQSSRLTSTIRGVTHQQDCDGKAYDAPKHGRRNCVRFETRWQVQDIQTYERARRADLARKSKAERSAGLRRVRRRLPKAVRPWPKAVAKKAVMRRQLPRRQLRRRRSRRPSRRA